MVRRRKLTTCVYRSSLLNRGRVVHGVVLMSMERKSDEEAKKKKKKDS
jgi:hypothetical protein